MSDRRRRRFLPKRPHGEAHSSEDCQFGKADYRVEAKVRHWPPDNCSRLDEKTVPVHREILAFGHATDSKHVGVNPCTILETFLGSLRLYL